MVFAIFLPTLVYLAVMQFVGLYVSSAIFIAVFMRWQGKFSLVKSCLTGLIVSVVLFAMFEIWFNVPLLKGPLEAAFGY
jgi:Na+/proline symporter